MNVAWLIDSPGARLAGWALVHSLWQIAAITAVLAGALHALRDAPRLRYGLCALAMGLCVLVPAATLALMARPAGGTAGPRTRIAGRASSAPSAASPAETSPPRPEDRGDESAGATNATSRDNTGPEGKPAWAHWLKGRLGWLTLGWICGAGLVACWRIAGWFTLRRYRLALAPAPESWASRMHALADRMGTRRRCRLLTDTAGRLGPATVGLFKPVIILPLHILTQWPPAQVEALLAHELAHVKRWDAVALAIQAAARSVLFYHPGAAWICRRLDATREELCDDLALRFVDKRTEYAQALLTAAAGPAPTTALAAARPPLHNRIQRILKGHAMTSEICLRRLLPAALLPVLLAAALLGSACAQDGPGHDDATTQVTRQYDLSVLSQEGFVPSPLWARPDGSAAEKPEPRDARLQLLLHGLEGDRPAARFLGNHRYSIRADEHEHDLLRRRLGHLADQDGPIVEFRCRVMLVPAEADERIADNLRLGNREVFTDPDQVAGIAKAVSSQPRLYWHSSPALRAQAMRTASMQVGRQKGLRLPTAEGEKKSFLFLDGTAIEVLPSVEPGDGGVSLWIHPRVTQSRFKRSPGQYACAETGKTVTVRADHPVAIRAAARSFTASGCVEDEGKWRPEIQRGGWANWVAWLFIEAEVAPADDA